MTKDFRLSSRVRVAASTGDSRELDPATDVEQPVVLLLVVVDDLVGVEALLVDEDGTGVRVGWSACDFKSVRPSPFASPSLSSLVLLPSAVMEGLNSSGSSSAKASKLIALYGVLASIRIEGCKGGLPGALFIVAILCKRFDVVIVVGLYTSYMNSITTMKMDQYFPQTPTACFLFPTKCLRIFVSCNKALCCTLPICCCWLC